MYLYPNNLKAKPKLWLWHLKDIIIIGLMILIATFIYTNFNTIIFFVLTATYALLSLRFTDVSILDFIIYATHFFIIEPQTYYFKLESEV